jgi:hypothetical protein
MNDATIATVTVCDWNEYASIALSVLYVSSHLTPIGHCQADLTWSITLAQILSPLPYLHFSFLPIILCV